MGHLGEYCEAITAKLCVKCIDSDAKGHCRLDGEQECGVIIHFPKIVSTIFSVESDRLEPYIDALRQNVCTRCTYQSAEGKCALRDRVDCALDRYFPMIVNIVQESQLQFHEPLGTVGD